MPLFRTDNGGLIAVPQISFKNEKELQSLVEKSLLAAFNARFVASEFRTGAQHMGRIDTLALSEENNPVIVEYKNIESSDLITQSLFYLHWLADHRGDFEKVAHQSLGGSVEVDWSDIRVICIAPNYKRYDLHAVQVMGANIELWRYRLFANETLYLEEVYRQAVQSASEPAVSKNPVMVRAGLKAAATRAAGNYTFEEHLSGKSETIRNIALEVDDFITGLDEQILTEPKKYYVAYKASQNIVCMQLHKQHVALFLKLDPKEVCNPPENSRDMTSKGHYGTGDFELTLRSPEDVLAAKPFIEAAYKAVGG